MISAKDINAMLAEHWPSCKFTCERLAIWMDDNESQPCAIAQGAYILPA